LDGERVSCALVSCAWRNHSAAGDGAMKQPPTTVEMLWCPVCGRDDRATYLRERHFALGAICPGKPVKIIYKLFLQQTK
jgi:hypothetical protein